MTDLSMYDYLLRDAEVIDETDGAVTLNCTERDWNAVGYDLTDLPISLPGDMGGLCEIWEWDEKQEGHKIMAHLDADYVKRLKSTRIRIDHDAWKETGISDVRRPFFMVRGKSVSYEQVKFLLKNELEMFWVPDFFQAEDKCVESGGIFKYYDLNSEEGFGKLLPDRNGSSGGWLWDTGEIGGSGWDDKYPEFKDCMPRWFSLALKYPFLDMVAGYTLYVEQPCEFCPLEEYYEYQGYVRNAYERGESPKTIKNLELTMKSYERDVKDERFREIPCRRHRMRECESYFRSGRNFWDSGKQALGLSYAGIVYPAELAEDVVMTVRIHEGSLEVYTGVEAVRIFKEYDEKYGFADTWRYAAYNFKFFHELLQETLITEDTLRECLAEEGMDPDKCMEHLVRVFGLETKLMKRGKPCLR